MTLTEKVVRFLTEGLNCRELPSPSRKYRKFSTSSPAGFYWVGKAGSIRAGKTSSDNVSLSGQVISNMKLWERRKGLC